MTTTQIETQASRGNIAMPDFNLKIELRQNVVPKYLMDLDQAAGKKLFWRRKTLVVNIVAPTRTYDLADDFGWMERFKFYTSANAEYEPKFIGEDPDQVIIAEQTTVAAPPTGYYFVSGAAKPWALKVNTIPDAAYTGRGVYFRRIPFSDDSTDVDLSDATLGTYIPSEFQWGLVRLLRAEILKDRFGIGDPRYEAEKSEYGEWLSGVAYQKEQAGRNYAVFMS